MECERSTATLQVEEEESLVSRCLKTLIWTVNMRKEIKPRGLAYLPYSSHRWTAGSSLPFCVHYYSQVTGQHLEHWTSRTLQSISALQAHSAYCHPKNWIIRGSAATLCGEWYAGDFYPFSVWLQTMPKWPHAEASTETQATEYQESTLHSALETLCSWPAVARTSPNPRISG